MARKTREGSAAQTGSGGSHTGAATKPSEAAQQHNGSVPLNPDKLKRLYSTMLKCRMIEEKARELFKQGKTSEDSCSAIGQEAIEVGAAIDLLPEDCITLSDRDCITSFIKGTPLRFIFARLCAQRTGAVERNAASTRDGRAPLKIVTPASSITAHLDIVTGVALAYKMQKRPFVALAFCGDGAASLGHWHKALNSAGARKLPIVFVVENSSWIASASGGQRTAAEDLSVKALAYGFPGIAVDGNDAVAVYRVAQEAIRRAREGHGSALIECRTCRWSEPSEMDPAGHPSAAQAEYWKFKDPIVFMENYLKRRNLWSDEWKQNMAREFNKEMEEAIVLADQSAHPEPARRREQARSFEILEGELSRRPLKFRRRVSSPAKLGKS